MFPAQFSKWLWLIIPSCFALLVILFYPFRFILEFDSDEGINLIKSLLTLEGYDLYSQVWSDQPPILTYMLAGLIRVLGPNVTLVRLFILLLSCLLIAAVIVYLQQFWGTAHAVCGALLIMLLPNFTRLSVSVMIGLPSITIGMLSFVCLAFWHRQQRTPLLIGSGALLGISVMTKLQTVILAPIFGAGILISAFGQPNGVESFWKLVRPALTWTLAFICVVGAVFVLSIGPQGIEQLIGVHLHARDNATLQGWSGGLGILEPGGTWPIFLLAVVAAAFAFKTRSFTTLYLVAWIPGGLLLLNQLVPNWYHHQLLVTIPAAILAAIPVGEGIEVIRRGGVRSIVRGRMFLPAAAVVLGLAWFLINRLPDALGEYRLMLPNIVRQAAPPKPSEVMLAIISDYADQADWMITDRPMFAIRSGIPIPAEIAVISRKRFLTGSITQADILQAIESVDPEVVALTRFTMPEVYAYLSTDYRQLYVDGNDQLFVRRDIAGR